MCSLKWVNKEIHVYTKGHCLCVLPIVISNTIQGSLDALSRVPFFPFLKKAILLSLWNRIVRFVTFLAQNRLPEAFHNTITRSLIAEDSEITLSLLHFSNSPPGFLFCSSSFHIPFDFSFIFSGGSNRCNPASSY